MSNELSELKPTPGAKRPRIRVGRGNASGKGTTAGRGQKGQKSRRGGNIPAWFEGGQMPLQRRLPKRGFASTRKVTPEIVNLSDLEGLGDTVDLQVLIDAGKVPRKTKVLKVLGNGDLSTAITVRAHRFSKSARAKIEAAGGTAEEI
jgi:large subunit ribosomal protein L15